MTGCPCQHTTPCDPHCTCVDPYSSRGCDQCCRYGSPSQQRQAAERLARMATQRDALARLFDKLVDQLDVPDLALEAEDLWEFMLDAGLAHKEPHDPDGAHEHVAGLDGAEPGDMITVLTPLAEAILYWDRVDTVRREKEAT